MLVKDVFTILNCVFNYTDAFRKYNGLKDKKKKETVGRWTDNQTCKVCFEAVP